MISVLFFKKIFPRKKQKENRVLHFQKAAFVYWQLALARPHGFPHHEPDSSIIIYAEYRPTS